jgi:uncharacterized protein (TIGR03086 family)
VTENPETSNPETGDPLTGDPAATDAGAALATLRECFDLEQTVFDSASPDEIRTGSPTPCSTLDTAQLVEHVLGTQEFLIDALGGDVPAPGGAPADRHRRLTESALGAWAARGSDGEIDLGGNALPARFVLALHTLEAYIHAWDLAMSLGRPFDPSDDLTERVWEAARLVITDDVRSDAEGAPYRAAVEVDAGEPSLARLIGHSGRDPHWTAAAAPA